jgi:hypothetical protein
LGSLGELLAEKEPRTTITGTEIPDKLFVDVEVRQD